MKICSIGDCIEKSNTKGLCMKHYDKGRKQEYINRPEVKKLRKIYGKGYRQRPKVKEKDREYRQIPYVREDAKQWRKDNPEKCLGYRKKHFEKYGKTFNMNSTEFQYALMSWADTIKKLDNHMCKLCNSTKNINAHHLFPKSSFPELALDLDNGTTLCKECHEIIHGFKIY